MENVYLKLKEERIKNKKNKKSSKGSWYLYTGTKCLPNSYSLPINYNWANGFLNSLQPTHISISQTPLSDPVLPFIPSAAKHTQ